MEPTLSTRYVASLTEASWYEKWEKAGLFEPDTSPSKPVYSVTIPPPNITGSLHMGHALCYGLQDLLGRYKRMRGYSVLILPGQDHAGIATQSVVAKNLKKEGISLLQIGREAFEKRVWDWRKESGDTILTQFRSLGCAFDWNRTRFTLDETYAQAVLKVFVDWFDRGLIYRGFRVVNWDPILRTSVSDIETERRLVKGSLYYINYPFEDGSGHITIATTRPETMLADVAVAVHPEDARYKHLVGKTIDLPLVGRKIPLIADEYPDPAFGTGALKITPGHDANDFEVGARHGLEVLVAFDEIAKVTELYSPYAGMDRSVARKAVVADLEAQGFIEKIEDHEIALVVSTRSNEQTEPMASEQWFVKQSVLAQQAIEAVNDGRVDFFPNRYKSVCLDWMENVRDWCVSRQLWWGHRIPVYYTEDGTAFAAVSRDEAQKKAGGKTIVRQDEDVLDTWFSSGLWPFATMGWPEKTQDLEKYYPTSVLVTARDIIYLWVARMMMMGLDLVGDIPFHDVFIYATILTEDGKRMSKSLGTGVDPMDVVRTRGADALRYTLFSQTGANQDIRYSEKKTEDARNFCNKIWNASRFIMMNLEGATYQVPESFFPIDLWLLSRLKRTEQTVRESYEAYDIQSATQALYQFFWSELCDWYIEMSKDRLGDPDRRHTPQWVLTTSLDAFLKMMHPVMPHLTEEVYSHLPIPAKAPFLMAAEWPSLAGIQIDENAETSVERWLELTRSVRALRAELGLAAMKQIDEAYFEGDLGEGATIVANQAWIADLKQGRPLGKYLSVSCPGVDFHIPTSGLVDEATESKRIGAQIEKTLVDLTKLESRLNNPRFVERAKPEVVEKERASVAELKEILAKLEERKRLFSA